MSGSQYHVQCRGVASRFDEEEKQNSPIPSPGGDRREESDEFCAESNRFERAGWMGRTVKAERSLVQPRILFAKSA